MTLYFILILITTVFNYNCADVAFNNTTKVVYNKLINNTKYVSHYASSTTTEISEKCNFPTISNLTTLISNNKLEISWDPVNEINEDDCLITYNVNITYKNEIFPYFRRMIENKHDFNNLHPCEYYNLSITASNKYDETAYITKMIKTDPEDIKQLSMNIFNGITNITWDKAESDYCSKYKLIIRDRPSIEINDNGYIVDEALYCTKIGIQTIRSDGVLGNLSYVSVPGVVEQLEISDAQAENLTASWLPPKDATCVVGYVIILKEDGKEIKRDELVGTSYTFKDINSCAKYTVTVIAKSDTDNGEEVTIDAETIKPVTLYKVESFKMKFNEENLTLQAIWAPPIRQSKCVDNYMLITNVNDLPGESKQVTELSYTFEKVTGCSTYTVQIVARIGVSQEGVSIRESTTVPEMISNPPTNKRKQPEKTSVILKWGVDAKTVNNCEQKMIIVSCIALDTENEDLEWIVKSKEIETIINDERKDIDINVLDLSEFTNYTCVAQLENVKGFSEKSAEVKFMTFAEVPSAPRDFEATNVEKKSFDLSWKIPYKVPGILQDYKLSISIESLHYIPPGCFDFENSFEKTIESNVNEFNFKNGYPHFIYNASISAKTIGYGVENHTFLNTYTDEPEAPRNFEKSEDIIGEQNNLTLIFSWLYPCNTNGILKEFEMVIDGTSTNEKFISKVERIIKVKVNDESHNIDYILDVSDIRPSYNYTISVKGILDDDTKGKDAEINFISPDGFPSAPILKPITDITANAFTINWDEPEQKNGVLKKYQITIKSIAPKHEVPLGCPIDLNITYIEINANDVTTYTFEDALPNYEYELFMNASTDAGYGKLSEPIKTETLETKSETVRQLNYAIKQINDSELYDYEVEINFKTPCNLNGNFEKFVIHLVSERNGLNTTRLKEEGPDLSYKFPLQPQFDYIVSVEVITGFVSELAELNFTSPAGVPTPALQVLNVIDDSVIIKDKFFDDIAGDIIYYAIILSYNNGSNNERYGYWDGNEWPEHGQWSDDGDVIPRYQTTPDKWNPFIDRDDLNETEITFKLGTDKNCSHSGCNGPLRANTKYSIELRGFTNNGFRDSETFDYVTLSELEDLDKALTVIEIIGIVVGCLAIILISGILFIFWRKRRGKHIEDDEEIVEIFPISVTVNKFPKYYTDLKENMHKLKNEFSILNTKSADDSSSCDVGQLPENKKKNRYTNILPYDDNRIILQNDEESDYINASPIKGYTDKVEYIATQGPLENTTLDFWKMVIDENVTVIVMVAQFIEQRKEKCHKYFPDNHEQVEIGDNIQIRCATELDFLTYKERHIIIQKDNEQFKIIHLQFMDWPDFGCPKGTENMLNFCNVMRRSIENSYGKTIMHCSAGVGRTGTLIAIDMLLQIIQAGGEIDVYSIVSRLRKQRKSMVQTEGQYMYIYTCIYDSIKRPAELKEIKSAEPIYENLQEKIPLKEIKSDSNENVEEEIAKEEEENEANSSL